MLRDVENILDHWESSGLLEDCTDPFNLALVLETQRRVSAKTDGHYCLLKKVFPACLCEVNRQNPDLLRGLIEFETCCEMYRLGHVPPGDQQAVMEEVTRRLLEVSKETLYFAGVVVKEDQIYLVASAVE